MNETLQTGTITNRTYWVGVNTVRVEITPTGPDRSGCAELRHTECAYYFDYLFIFATRHSIHDAKLNRKCVFGNP